LSASRISACVCGFFTRPRLLEKLQPRPARRRRVVVAVEHLARPSRRRSFGLSKPRAEAAKRRCSFFRPVTLFARNASRTRRLERSVVAGHCGVCNSGRGTRPARPNPRIERQGRNPARVRPVVLPHERAVLLDVDDGAWSRLCANACKALARWTHAAWDSGLQWCIFFYRRPNASLG